jgi:sugar phosphate permease
MTDQTTNSTTKYRGYALFILTGVYVFNFIDRQILVILQESIKQELDLSDTQLGLMSGFTFAIFYVSFGIPIARLADKGNRRNIIAISLTIWSAMTALSGSAQNFVQLLCLLHKSLLKIVFLLNFSYAGKEGLSGEVVCSFSVKRTRTNEQFLQTFKRCSGFELPL